MFILISNVIDFDFAPARDPDMAASSVDTWNNLRASSTFCSLANGSSLILARLSLILITASSCLTVIGMDIRFMVSCSCCFDPLRIRTYLLRSLDAASAEIRGPHRLQKLHHNNKFNSRIMICSVKRPKATRLWLFVSLFPTIQPQNLKEILASGKH